MTKVVGNYFTAELIRNILKILLSSLVALIAFFIINPIGFPGGKFAFILKLGICALLYFTTLLLSGCLKYILSKENIPVGEDK